MLVIFKLLQHRKCTAHFAHIALKLDAFVGGLRTFICACLAPKQKHICLSLNAEVQASCETRNSRGDKKEIGRGTFSHSHSSDEEINATLYQNGLVR